MKAKECPKCKQIVKNESATYCPTCYTKLEETEYEEADVKKIMKNSPRGGVERALIIFLIGVVIINLRIGIKAISFTPDNYKWILSSSYFRPKAELVALADKGLFVDHIFGYICIVLAVVAAIAVIGMIMRKKIGFHTAYIVSIMIMISQIINYFVLHSLFDKISGSAVRSVSFPTETIIWHLMLLFISYKHYTTEAYCAYD